MSGGFFDYDNQLINSVADRLANVIKRRGIPSMYDENVVYPTNWSEETYRELANGLTILRIAHVYANRIDYLLSEDDGEETFLQRLKEDLQRHKEEFSNLDMDSILANILQAIHHGEYAP
jgi:wyosine [tRNA(Phe)-imidazoG37] synthetase (radical SAM superfamily)